MAGILRQISKTTRSNILVR